MQESANIIGPRVRAARLLGKPKITQAKLAILLQVEGLDLDQVQISKIENGVRPVSDIELSIIAKVLKVSASWLLGETGKSDRLL